MGKHFELDIGPGHFAFRRKEASIHREAALDGVYVIRINVPPDDLPPAEVVAGYKYLRQWRAPSGR